MKFPRQMFAEASALPIADFAGLVEPFPIHWHKCEMDEEQLIAGLKDRESGAVEELVNSFGDRLLRSAFLLCGNETEAEDLVQETFLQAMRSAHRFQGRSSAHTWLHAILLNLTRRHHRDSKRIVYDNQWAEGEMRLPRFDGRRIGATSKSIHGCENSRREAANQPRV